MTAMKRALFYLPLIVCIILGISNFVLGAKLNQANEELSMVIQQNDQELESVHEDLDVCASTLREKLEDEVKDNEIQEIKFAMTTLRPSIRYDVLEETAQAIHKYANEFDVDYQIAVAIAHHESGFNPYAISPVGARGTMQVMPFWRNKIEFLQGYGDLHNIDKNVRAGLYIYRKYLDEFDDNEVLALLAYNRGPGTVKRYIRNGRDPSNGYSVAVLRNRNKISHKM